MKLLKPAILSVSLLTIMANAAIAPALGQISDAFPSASPTLIQMIATLPAILIIFFSLLSGRLAVRMRQRHLLSIGLIAYVVGGVGGGFANSIAMLLVFRGVLGAGVGLIVPLSTALIADFYVGDQRRTMMGYSSAVSNLGGVITILLGGWLATMNWRYTFGLYLLALLVLLLTALVLPEPDMEARRSRPKVTLPRGVYGMAILAFLFMVAFYVIPTGTALYLRDEQIGNAGDSGLVMAALTLSTFLVGVFYARTVRLLRRASIAVGLALIGAGFLALGLAGSLGAVLVSMCLVGLGIGVIQPSIMNGTANLVPQHASAPALSIVSSAQSLGQFVSPIAFALIGQIAGNRAIRFSFQASAVGFAVAAVAAGVLAASADRWGTAPENV